MRQERKIKVLLTGIGQANFLIQLYEKVIPWNNMIVDVVNMKFKSEEQKIASDEIFHKRVEFKFKISFCNLFKLFFNSVFWKFFILEWNLGELNSFKKLKSILYQHLYHSQYAKYLDKEKYDYIHHHFLWINYGLYLVYLKKHKTILTFWGSDLFRQSNHKDLFFKKIVLDRAISITTATNDMKLHIMSKYGIKYREKIKVMKFINRSDYFEYCDSIGSEKKAEIKQELFPQIGKKNIIAFGHSGFKEDNYNSFLKTLEKMKEQERENFHFLFCLSYGADKEFLIRKLRRKLEELRYAYTIIEDYISYEKMAEYHTCVDAFIFAPDSDGFSGYLTECFYHEIPVFVGAWLPYKEFLRMGLKFHEFEEFNEIKEILLNIKNFKYQDYAGNKEIVRKYFVEENDSYKWSKLYH